ncbi:MAG: cupin domain-containing protein [Candidatus Wildermuthbacteria bacterium]|nr:cupin domain-containing protein [Candidatus Wildermuthbacteria bacterium]
MKVVYKNQTKEFKNSDKCTAIEYPLGDKDINGAVIELTGRYPGKGRVINLRCKELAYVIKGSGKVVVEGKEVKLQEGDLILIEPGEKFFWEGNMTMFMPCTPAWYPEQHKEVE